MALLAVTLAFGFIENGSKFFEDREEVRLEDMFSLRIISSQNDFIAASEIGLALKRDPYILHVFEQGITNHLGKSATVSQRNTLMLDGSDNLKNPLLSLFRELDFSFAAITLLSLMAILATFDSVCGERGNGTLRMVFVNDVPRFMFILSKLAAAFISLSIAFLGGLTFAAIILWIVLPEVLPLLTADSYARLLMMIVVTLLYLLVWVSIGTLISSLSRHRATSFIVSFIVWVLLVGIVPQLGAVVSERIRPADSYAAIQGQAMRQISEEREDRLRDITDRQRWIEAEKTGRVGTYLAEVAKAELDLQQEVFNRYLEEFRRKHEQQLSLAALFARTTSPAAALEFALQELSGSGWSRQAEYLDQLRHFKRSFLKTIYNKLDAIRPDPEKPWEQWDLIYDNTKLDITQKETDFAFEEPDFNAVTAAVSWEIFSLSVSSLILVLLSIIAMNRYDVR